MSLHTTPANRSFARLDVLRCTAVLLVLFAHISQAVGILETSQAPFFRVGRLGVLFFFVHTCIVLMMSLERHQDRYGNERILRSFAVRRFFRLFPLSVVVLSAVFFLHIPAGSISTHKITRMDQPFFPNYLANLTLVQNMVSENPRDASILAPLWSLPFEVEMYIVLPFLFLLVPRGVRLWSLLTAWVVTVIAAFTSQSLLAEHGITLAHYSWGTINFPRFFILVPCFFAGVIAYYRWNRANPVLPFAVMPVTMLIIVLAYRATIATPNYATFVGMAGCLTLGLMLPNLREPSNRILIWSCEIVAKYSYGIYLLHLPVLWFAFDLLKGIPLAAQFAIFFTLLTVLSYLAFTYIEEPMIRYGQRRSAHKPSPATPHQTPKLATTPAD